MDDDDEQIQQLKYDLDNLNNKYQNHIQNLDKLNFDIQEHLKENEQYESEYEFLRDENELKILELDKLKKEFEKMKLNKENFNISDSVTNNPNKNINEISDICDKVIDVYENKKSSVILDNFLNDYKIILSEINQIYSKEKNNESSKNDVIYIEKENSNDPQIALKIVDNFQCFLDVLKEACRYYDYHPADYMIKDKKNNINVILTQPVKNFLEKNPNEKVFCLFEKSDKEKEKLNRTEIFLKINHVEERKENMKLLDKEMNYEKNINILDDELIDVENNLINKLMKIICYLLFLCVVFVYYMNKFQIQQRFYLDEAVKSQIFEKTFYQMNKYGLDNSFSNLGDSADLEKWFFDAYTDIFQFGNFVDIKKIIDENGKGTRFLDNFYVVGKTRYIQFSKFVESDFVTKRKNYNGKFYYPFEWFELKTNYPSLNNLAEISQYNNEFKNFSICNSKNDFDFEYDGEIVSTNKYNVNFNKNWYNSTMKINSLSLNTFNLIDDQIINKECNGVFYNDISTDRKRINLLSSYLRNLRFFNFKTMIFIIKINGYNVNKNLFVNIQLIFEQNEVGKIKTSYKICSLNVMNDIATFPLPGKINATVIINYLIFPFLIIYTIYNLYEIVIETIENVRESDFRKNTFRLGKSFKEIWFYFKIVQTLLFFFSIIMRIYLYITLVPLFKYAKNKYIDIESKCNLLETVTLLETFIICSTLLYFLRYLERNIIKPISDTIVESYQQIIIFFTSYLLVIFGFSFFCFYVFGVKESKFRTINRSVLQLFFMIFGDFDILKNMFEFFPVITMIFILMFGLIFNILFSNWLIATIIHSFSNVKKREKTMKETQGKNHIPFTDELTLIFKKLIRSFVLLWRSGLDQYKILRTINEIIEKAKFYKD